MAGGTVSILEGNTFVVSDERGDVEASPDEPHGLFHADTRFLSRWRLAADGTSLNRLSTDDLQYFRAQFFLVAGTGTIYSDSTLSVIRTRSVGDGFHEDLTVLNHGAEPVELRLRVEAAADFADLFEVKDALAKKGELSRRVEDGRLVLAYRRDSFVRETWISATASEASVDEDGITFAIRVEPKSEWTTCLDVAAVTGAADGPPLPKYRHGDERARPNLEISLDEWLDAAPILETDMPSLPRTYQRSLVDLAALRFYPLIMSGRAVPAAGLPWFMTLFGRDSLLTSYQALPFTPELAETTVLVLAARQAQLVDDFRDAEPGKILHELRFGELTAFEERPHSPYYGSADSTPLFLILLDEVARWMGNVDVVRRLEPAARRALAWIDTYGDRDGDGYVEYDRRNEQTGLENQCWKDSWNSILFADGTLSSLPRATCEIQGYVYDAKVRAGRLARDVWGDAALADQLEKQAAELKRRFNEDFWLADREYFALALDGEKRPVDSLTSNIGHLLWSGIVDEEKAPAVARHLMGPRLFSGWGVRTMAEGDGGYNPIGYHNGTVWPHDNSLIALGLARYGYRDEAARLSLAMLDAAAAFDGRLPEAFAGYVRERTRFPVEYPTACSPQAWATGAPLALLRALLGLEPRADRLHVEPHLPAEIRQLELHGIPGRWGRADAVAAPVRAADPRALAAVFDPPPASAAEFFGRLPPAVRVDETDVRGTILFDVLGAGAWRAVVAGGTATFEEGAAEADAAIELAEAVFIDILGGRRNGMTAVMQGEVRVTGDIGLAQRFVRFVDDSRVAGGS